MSELNAKIIKVTNVMEEDFTHNLGQHDAPKKNQLGELVKDHKGRQVMHKVPNLETIKASQTVLMPEPKAKFFAKHLVNKILLDSDAANWTDELLRKPLLDAVLNQDEEADVELVLEVEEKGEPEIKPGKKEKKPKVKVRRRRKVKKEVELDKEVKKIENELMV